MLKRLKSDPLVQNPQPSAQNPQPAPQNTQPVAQKPQPIMPKPDNSLRQDLEGGEQAISETPDIRDQLIEIMKELKGVATHIRSFANDLGAAIGAAETELGAAIKAFRTRLDAAIKADRTEALGSDLEGVCWQKEMLKRIYDPLYQHFQKKYSVSSEKLDSIFLHGSDVNFRREAKKIFT